MLHADLLSMPVVSCGMKSCLVLLDDFSKYARCLPLAHKNDTKTVLITWLPWYERQKGNKLKVFRSDRGGEFLNSVVDELFMGMGVEIEPSPPYTPQANGAAERVNPSLIDRVRAIAFHGGFKATDWVYLLAQNLSLIHISEPTRPY